MKKIYASILFLFTCSLIFAQQPGDTIRVQAWNFQSDSRDTVISFPTDENITYEKILLKYSMRCHDALVSNVVERNLGCREWDFSCNTYLIDSSKVESVPSLVPSHFITSFEGESFPFSETPVYDLVRGTRDVVELVDVISETEAVVGESDDAYDNLISTNNLAGRSQFLYTAAELTAAGLVAGDINAIGLNVLESGSESRFVSISMKHSAQSELLRLEEFFPQDEVYYNEHVFEIGTTNRFELHSPFQWDGVSNVVVEYNLTNVNGSLSDTQIEGEQMDVNMGLSAVGEDDIMLIERTHVECLDYGGIAGSQNRTIEAWVNTINGRSGEIMSFGNRAQGEKYTFRFQGGRLRLEVDAGGTEGSRVVDDNEWHHVALVLDGDNLTDAIFYVDGVLDPLSNIGDFPINTNTVNNLQVNRGLNNRYFDATIDDVRLWDVALSQETIANWRHLKVDESHPNYDNLQLHFEFNGDGDEVLDSSPHGRHGRLIGQERFETAEVSGNALFKNFSKTNVRPTATFYQGEYTTNVISRIVERPIAKSPRHLVIERSIEETDPTVAIDDNILVDGPIEYWVPEVNIIDEQTGQVIETNAVNQDGVIDLVDLEYTRRFPFYNELVSFVTPYGINLDFGTEGRSWYMDMTDYVSILKGNKRLQMTLGGQNQEEMDLEFLFIVGTPPRDVVQYEQIWQGTNRIGIANINQILSDEKFAPIDFELADDAVEFQLKSSITGHGSEGEFQANGGVINHMFSVDEIPGYIWNIHRECSFNPIFPQGGTWVFDRQGWCPGEETYQRVNDLTPLAAPGSTVTFDYSISNPIDPGGDYRYHVAHQLLGYGPANFQNDAAVTRIVAPNNSAEFTRVGTICDNPMVTIRNTGANNLTSLTIRYWINDSQAPQTYEWTGNLGFMQSEDVVIPSGAELWFDLQAENNKFHVEIESPNGAADEYGFNNTFTSDFNFPEIIPSDFSVEVITNSFAFENSYQILDSEGNVVGANNLNSPNSTTVDDYNLPEGCYTFRFFDSGNDGLEFFANPGQGVGFVWLKNSSNQIIRNFDSDFGGGFDFVFSTTFPVSTQDLDFMKSIEVYPNPARDVYTLEAENIADADVHMINAVGQWIPTKVNGKSQNAINFDVSDLEAGVYFIAIHKGDIQTTRKLVISK